MLHSEHNFIDDSVGWSFYWKSNSYTFPRSTGINQTDELLT